MQDVKACSLLYLNFYEVLGSTHAVDIFLYLLVWQAGVSSSVFEFRLTYLAGPHVHPANLPNTIQPNDSGSKIQRWVVKI